MSGLYPLTINTDPSAEAHIYAEDDAAIYQSIFGSDGVCNIGQACAATVISNNKVRVADGVICVGGHMARVRYGEYQDCEIMNGQTGYNRNDIIVAKFVTTGTQGTDTYTIEVVQGSAVTGSATDPALTQGNLYEGDKIRMMPLYRVKIEGLSIVAVEQLFELIPTIPELKEQVAELNGKLENPEWSGEYGFFVPLNTGVYYSNVIAFIPLPDANTKYNVKVISASAQKSNISNDVLSKTTVNTFSGGIGVYVQDNTYAGCMLSTVLSIIPK